MKYLTRYAAIGTIALLALTGCHPNEDSANPAGVDKTGIALTLKLYAVPADRTKSIQDAVDGALGGIDVKLFGGARASITAAGPGKLLVYAPRDAQASIGDAIAALSKSTQTAVAPVQVEVRFWVVDGESGIGTDDPALKPLAAALDGLRQNMGPMHFSLDRAAALVGSSDENGSLTTANGPYERTFRFHIHHIDDGAARLRLDYQDNGGNGLGKLSTDVDAAFDQYIVLAQAPGPCQVSATNTTRGDCTRKAAMRLLVVQVSRLAPKA